MDLYFKIMFGGSEAQFKFLMTSLGKEAQDDINHYFNL